MKKFVLALLAMAATAPALADSAPVGQGLDIVAVVGDQAISSYDLNARIKFVIATTHMSNTPDMLARVRPQIVRSLIDEKLQLAEAKKNDIKVTQADIDQAIASIEEQRGMPSGAIDKMLKDNNVPKETFIDQIRAQLAWNKLLMKKIRPQVHISEDEIALAAKRFAAEAASVKKELQIAVIALPVDKPAHEAEVRRAGDKLVKEVRGGASFEEVSRQFSSGAANTGAFWVEPGQLDPVVARLLVGAKQGDITDPIRTGEGFSIIKVYNSRAVSGQQEMDVEVLLKEILLKLKPDASAKEADAMLQIGEEVARHPGSCEEKGIASIKDLDDFDITVDFQRETLSQLPPALKIIAENLKVGDISTPFASDEGIRLYMLCDKKEGTPTLDHVHVGNMLLQQRMELEAQKYMRNLRREAFIEVR